MLFNSIDFFIFFAVVTSLYFLLPHKFRWALLLGASCYFYMAFMPVYILILALTIAVDYFAAIEIEKSTGPRKKAFLMASVISTCAILFVFKYFNFFNANVDAIAHFFHWNYPIKALSLILPIGLSFHTFQSLSYVFEVYRGNQKVEKNFGIYSLYVMFYPQLVAGPIERPQNLLHQFYEKHYFEYERVKKGLVLILWGLFRKMVVADRLSLYVNEIYNNPGKYHGWPVLVGIIFFAFQIYFDFSGYSDIALGTAKVMGFNLMINFNRPYSSKSLNEFWHRWHISLSTWFRDYLYIPLGGNRVVKWRWYYNLFIIFVVSGLWHGAAWTFIIWGALHGSVIVFENVTKKSRMALSELMPKPLFNLFSQVIVFCFVTFAWIFFRAKTVHDVFTIIGSVFQPAPLASVFKVIYSPFQLGLLVLILALVLINEYRSRSYQNFDLLITSRPRLARWSLYLGLTAGIIILGNFGNIDFIYFQF